MGKNKKVQKTDPSSLKVSFINLHVYNNDIMLFRMPVIELFNYSSMRTLSNTTVMQLNLKEIIISFSLIVSNF